MTGRPEIHHAGNGRYWADVDGVMFTGGESSKEYIVKELRKRYGEGATIYWVTDTPRTRVMMRREPHITGTVVGRMDYYDDLVIEWDDDVVMLEPVHWSDVTHLEGK